MIKISGDQDLLKLLTSKKQTKDGDNILSSIIFEGKEASVDRTIGYLQSLLERKVPMVPYARLSGLDGMRLSRATFAVLLKFSEFFDDFSSMVDEVDMKWEDVKD